MASGDFKSLCRAPSVSEVGSIPTRSRHRFAARSRADSPGSPRCLLAALAACSAPTVARAAVADSLAAVPPAAVVVVGKPAPARADSVRKQPWHEQPRFVMARSLLVPGWGQLHNRAWIKAILIAGVEGLLISRIVQGQDELDRLLAELEAARAAGDTEGEAALVNEYNSQLDERVGNEWKLGAVIAYSMVDAYVDAHFRGFDVEFRTDPALPAGTSPSGQTSGGSGAGMRLALRWNF